MILMYQEHIKSHTYIWEFILTFYIDTLIICTHANHYSHFHCSLFKMTVILVVFASAIATSNDEALNQLIFPSSPPFLPLSKSD